MVQAMRDKISKNDALMNREPVEYQFRPELNKIFGKGGVIQQSNPKYS